MLLIDDAGLGSLGKFKWKKKFFRKLAPKVFVPKPILKKAPILRKLPGVTQIPTTVKEAKAMKKDDIKTARAAYVNLVMKPMAKIDPVMAKHYDHELRDNEIKALRVQIDATDDPAQRQALEARLKSLAKKEEAYQKQGAIVRTIVSIAAMVVPVLAPIAIYWQVASAAYAAAKTAGNIQAQKKAISDMKHQEAEAIGHMVSKGLSQGQAQQVLGLLKQGVPVEDALKRVLAAPPADEGQKLVYGVPAPISLPGPDWKQRGTVKPGYSTMPVTKFKYPEYKTMRLESPQAAQKAFLDWLKGYNPEAYDAVLREMPRAPGAMSLSGYRDYDDLSGLGFWDTLATAASSIVSAAGTLMKGVYDKKLMDLQIKQMKAQQAPLPTPVAQQVVEGQRPAPATGVMAGLPSWALPVGIAGAIGLGFFLFRGRGRRRR